MTFDNTWSINGFFARFRRGFFVIFSVDVEIIGFDILKVFMKVNVDFDYIVFIKYRNLNCFWVVSFID